jgi:hypothetical protein
MWCGVDGVLCNCVVTRRGVTMECAFDVVLCGWGAIQLCCDSPWGHDGVRI